MRVFLTGITGFIGRSLASTFAEMGWEVGALVRAASLDTVSEIENLDVVSKDLSDLRGDEDFLAGYDLVIHTAAIRNRWGTSEEAYERVNVEATRRLLECAQNRVKRFVYISSVGVYGFPGKTGIDERFSTETEKSGHGYHRTKAKAEIVVREYADQMEIVIVRPTITYGPGDEDGMVTRLIGMLSVGQFMYMGNGHNHIHLTYIDDLVKGILLASTHPTAPGQTFNIGGPSSNSMVEIVDTITGLLEVRSPDVHIPLAFATVSASIIEAAYRFGNWLGIIRSTQAPFLTRDKVNVVSKHRSFSIKAAEDALGYHPDVDLKAGLARTLTWLIEERNFAGSLHTNYTGTEVMES
ncbi:MAG: NAD-dependent epimerase/dehydratase family protein [Anaerolineales bacterium]|nr:NAD-dependent epimerase/dehydratase family protein [Anaerolineales bacterium]